MSLSLLLYPALVSSHGFPSVTGGRRSRVRRPALPRQVLHPLGGVRRRPGGVPQGRPGRRRLLPRPLEPRQGGPVHPRGELHRLLLVEGVRPRRHHHLGVPADRLPLGGPGRPEYEPRGCPRGAAFSWYTYSPTRVRYPYVRGVLLEMYREAKARLGDPVLAWADVVGDPERRRRYQPARGKGGLVRASWPEAVEIAAAAHVNTIKTYGPDRCAGFSPIPAMSMVSHCVGTRFTQLIGGVMTSFYDWYADLPVASPQVFGDQTDVPESGDWWDATLPDDVGLQRPGHPDPGRALDGRGALSRHQGGHGQPGLRRQHQVRRRVAARPGRHRRRPGHGHGPRDLEGVLRRPPGAVLRRLRAPVHRPAVPGHAHRGPGLGRRSRRRSGAGQVPHRRGPGDRGHAGVPRGRLEDRAAGRGHRRAGVPNGSLGFRYAERRGQVEPGPRGVVPALSLRDARSARRRPRCCCRTSPTPAARAACCAAGCRSPGSTAGWSPPCST